MYIGLILRWVFTYILYPVVVFSILFLTFFTIVNFVNQAQPGTSRIRRGTAAVLPIIQLVFFVLLTDQGIEPLEYFSTSISPLSYFFLGAAIGVVILEWGKYLDQSDSDIGPSVYILFLSTTGVFIFYCIMQGVSGSLHYFLSGITLGGGLDILFRGLLPLSLGSVRWWW